MPAPSASAWSLWLRHGHHETSLLLSQHDVMYGVAQVDPRLAPRLKHLRKHAQLSAQEQAIEDFMRYNAPARFSQYEALQSAADASWQAADSAQLSVNAIAKVPTLCQTAVASGRLSVIDTC